MFSLNNIQNYKELKKKHKEKLERRKLGLGTRIQWFSSVALKDSGQA